MNANRLQHAAAAGGIIAFTFQESDDGRLALVEFVALDPAAFQPILADKQSGVKAFVKGAAKRQDIETEREFTETAIGRRRVRSLSCVP